MDAWLESIARVRWPTLQHAYGAAGDIPRLLWRLTSESYGERDQVGHDLLGALCHQGDVCPATAAAFPVLADLLTTEGAGACEAASLLLTMRDASERRQGPADIAVRDALTAVMPVIERAARSADRRSARVPFLHELLTGEDLSAYARANGVTLTTGTWSCAVKEQPARTPLDEAGAELLVAALPADASFKSQVDALLLAVELSDPSVKAHAHALRALERVSDPMLAPKAEFTRLFAQHGLGRIDASWREAARVLVEAWIDGASAASTPADTAPSRHLTRQSMVWLGKESGGVDLAARATACKEPVTMLELSPWGHWLESDGSGLVEIK